MAEWDKLGFYTKQDGTKSGPANKKAKPDEEPVEDSPVKKKASKKPNKKKEVVELESSDSN